jgi:hypothetical protein
MFYHEQRQRLADRLIRYPLVSLLVMSPWFAATLILFLALAGLGALGFPKIWVTSPPGFRPLVRVSLLDRVQAWALQRNALQMQAAGDQTGANKAWASAIANNPANVALLRRSLVHVAQARWESRISENELFSRIGWLFRLASTNREDVVLAAEAAEAAGLPPTALELLQPHLDTLPPRVYAAHLRALFLLRRADEFDRRWQNAPNTAKADPHTVLCRMAYDAGWGASDSISEARAALARALNDPKLWVTACRAQMVLSSHLLDAEGYAAALHRLELENLERLNERLQYWRLLVQIGRKAEAVRSAGAAFTPRSSQEVLDLLEAYRNLGLTADAIALIRRSLPRFGADPSRAGIGLWMASIEVLIEERLWDDLLAISVEMRNVGDNTAALAGVSRFAEGRALLARGHDQSADTALQDAARLAWPDPNFAAGAAAAMLRLHRPRPALELLGRFEEPLRSSVIYWQAVFDAAYAIKEDSELLLRAATNARDLKPEDPVVSINYAAALLINRKSADEASKITLTFFQKNPGALAAKVNHCFALAMNRRAEEARVLLATVDPTTLNDLELTVFHLCWIEIELQLRHWEACRTHLAKVDRRFLFPSQTRWIDQVRREAAGKS